MLPEMGAFSTISFLSSVDLCLDRWNSPVFFFLDVYGLCVIPFIATSRRHTVPPLPLPRTEVFNSARISSRFSSPMRRAGTRAIAQCAPRIWQWTMAFDELCLARFSSLNDISWAMSLRCSRYLAFFRSLDRQQRPRRRRPSSR